MPHKTFNPSCLPSSYWGSDGITPEDKTGGVQPIGFVESDKTVSVIDDFQNFYLRYFDEENPDKASYSHKIEFTLPSFLATPLKYESNDIIMSVNHPRFNQKFIRDTNRTFGAVPDFPYAWLSSVNTITDLRYSKFYNRIIEGLVLTVYVKENGKFYQHLWNPPKNPIYNDLLIKDSWIGAWQQITVSDEFFYSQLFTTKSGGDMYFMAEVNNPVFEVMSNGRKMLYYNRFAEYSAISSSILNVNNVSSDIITFGNIKNLIITSNPTNNSRQFRQVSLPTDSDNNLFLSGSTAIFLSLIYQTKNIDINYLGYFGYSGSGGTPHWELSGQIKEYLYYGGFKVEYQFQNPKEPPLISSYPVAQNADVIREKTFVYNSYNHFDAVKGTAMSSIYPNVPIDWDAVRATYPILTQPAPSVVIQPPFAVTLTRDFRTFPLSAQYYSDEDVNGFNKELTPVQFLTVCEENHKLNALDDE